MPYRYILLDHAQKEYETSLEWYTKRSPKAAENFMMAMDNALQLICEYPIRWRNTYKDYHELGLKKYPLYNYLYDRNK